MGAPYVGVRSYKRHRVRRRALRHQQPPPPLLRQNRGSIGRHPHENGALAPLPAFAATPPRTARHAGLPASLSLNRRASARSSPCSNGSKSRSPTPARPTRARPRGCCSGSARTRSGTLALGVFFGIWLDARAGADAVRDRPRDPARHRRGATTGRSRSGRSSCSRSALMQAFAGVMRHRLAVFNWLQASFRLAQVVSHHAARSGPAVRGALSTGEVVATVSNDAMRAGGAFDITARLSGAVVAYVVVARDPRSRRPSCSGSSSWSACRCSCSCSAPSSSRCRRGSASSARRSAS